MKPDELNFRHLLYFWTVAQEGSITRASERLGLSVQAISTQLSMLERQLGQALFAPQGRSLVLTEAGRTTLVHAEQIFHIGKKLRQALADRSQARPRFAVGVTDAVPKLIAFRLLEGLLLPPLSVRLECIEGELEHLLGELGLNRLDLVIADRSAPQRANLKLRSHLLGGVGIALFGTTELHERYKNNFPQGLDGAPLLLPARRDSLRSAIDAWLETHEIRPDVVAEFTDSALMKTFGRAGLGLFPAPAVMEADVFAQFGARSLGIMEDVSENWYAISVPRRIPHPALAHILAKGSADWGSLRSE